MIVTITFSLSVPESVRSAIGVRQGAQDPVKHCRTCLCLQGNCQKSVKGGYGGGVQIIAWSSSSDNIGAFASFKVKQFAAVV